MLWFWLFWILLIFAVAAAPVWPHSRGWGYAPAGGLFLGWLLLLIAVWWGVIAWAWPGW